MTTKTKGWLIVATGLIVAGCLIFVGVMTVFRWDFKKLQTDRVITNEHIIHQPFTDISISTKTADIVFALSDDTATKVVCKEQNRLLHTVTVENGTLVVRLNDTRKWYDYIGIHFETPQIMVHIPAGEYGALSLQASTGDITIPKNFEFSSAEIAVNTGDIETWASTKEHLSIKTTTGDISVNALYAKTVQLSVTTGDIIADAITVEKDMSVAVRTGKAQIRSVRCANLSSAGTTGDLLLSHVVAEQAFSLVRSTGDISLEACDANELTIKTTTGDVSGELLSDKIFVTKTTTGSVRVPDSTQGGKCQITTGTGKIAIDTIQ